MPDPIETLSRRRLLEWSGAGYLGLNLGGLWRAKAAASPAPSTVRPELPPLRACILIFYYGGPSHLDTFDLKPDAPAEVRGEFRPIATSVPGISISEHLPRMARLMDKVALIRSVHHEARLHDSAAIHTLTGRPLEGPDRELFAPLPQVYPSYGSAVAKLRPGPPAEVPFALLPFPFRNVVEVPCQGGGFLGSEYDPLRVDGDPATLAYQLDAFKPTEGVDRRRSLDRRHLREKLVVGPGGGEGLDPFYDRAYRLLGSDALREALDVTREPRRVRERYGFGDTPLSVGEGGGGGNGAELGHGRQLRGQNLLLARRLVEAGVPFVNVHDFRQQGQNWDAHFKCANQHKRFLLPEADRSLSALIEDLNARGLLDSTLVVVTGEFGRTPRINADAGRDHWPDCYSVMMAGGGIVGGATYGSSDRIGAYPSTDAVTPGDLAATIFWRFGIDPATEVRDALDRPHRLAAGEPLRRLFGA